MLYKVGLILVLICIPTIIGIRKSQKYVLREKLLRECSLLFKRIKNEMQYNLMILPNAIEASIQDFMIELKSALSNISCSMLDRSFTEDIVYTNIDSLPALCMVDKQIISQGITRLGASDLDTQIDILGTTIDRIDELVIEAKSSKDKNSKLYRTIGIVAGMMLAIMVI